MITPPHARANPLASGPLGSRADVERAVRDLYEPLRQHTSEGGARVQLGSFSAVFADRVAELEGFARPLYGIVPLAVGGGRFDDWDRIAAGLDNGTNPDSSEYWGPVRGDGDQRMVEQAAIGLALAFCPEQTWEQLSPAARDRLANWLRGIFEFDPVQNNWQFFRILVSLGLDRVGVSFDRSKLRESFDLIDSYRRGDHWYHDGQLANIDYYVPWAFHTYGLMYAAANKLGIGDDDRAAAYVERAAGFAGDFIHWFGPEGAAIPYGRSLTYRFATASMWGALAWADVEAVPWGVAKGMSMRHLRWWADKPVSDRDGVLSVGFTYDNRRLAEGYNSAGSPYWAMKFFSGLAAPADHPFWTADEAPQPILQAPVTLDDAGWIVDRDEHQAVSLIARQAPAIPLFEQVAAKYDKFAYSSRFGFSADTEAAFRPPVTDSNLALTDEDGTRRVKSGADDAGVEDGMAWNRWSPFPDVQVTTVLSGGAPWHLRLHHIETGRKLSTLETGFAIGVDPEASSRGTSSGPHHAAVDSDEGTSAIVDLDDHRSATALQLPVNANIIWSHAKVPGLSGELEPGTHRLQSAVYASPERLEPAPSDSAAPPPVPAAALDLLERLINE